ncbi:MAG: nicotinate-nucleotide adenylyltransferase [Chlorobi bacterium]|nr:nicotinate-nucleotide adenylyltransferase [Chlorobiota bacterium]
MKNRSDKKKIGLFFGSFNPVHTGHLILANYFTEHGGLDEVWFVLTPQNPLKPRRTLLPDYHRLYLLRLATEPYDKFKVSTVEFDLPRPNYTIHTLAHLEDLYPDKNFVLLMGEDTLASLPKWKNYEEILRRYQIYVYPRRHSPDTPLKNHPHVLFFDEAPLVEISASAIRRDLAEGKNVRPLLPEAVYRHIMDMHFYRKKPGSET